MKNFVHKIRALIAALIVCSPTAAFAEGQSGGGMPPAALSRSGRQFTYVIPSLRTQTSPSGATCTINSSTITASMVDSSYSAISTVATSQNGRDGHVWRLPFASVTSIAATSGFGAIPYPSRILVDFYDAATTGTLTCTSFKVDGYRWDGQKISESWVLDETARLTTNAFSTISAVTASGCSGGGSDDFLRFRTSAWVALPRRIASSADIDSVCVVRNNNSGAIAGGGSSFLTCLPGSSFEYSLAANSINVLDNEFFAGTTGAQSTATCQLDRMDTIIRGRASPFGTGF